MKYPSWVYVAVHLSDDTENQIKDYCHKNMPWVKMNEDLHSTLIYSKKPREKQLKREQFKWEWKFKKFSKFWDDWWSIVIELDSADMMSHNKKLMEENDFISDYDEYSPHITLSYEWQDVEVDNLPPLEIVYKMEHDFIEDLDDDEDETTWFVI